MLIRPYQPTDAEHLAAVYRAAVMEIGARAYDPQQVAVWAAFPDDIAEFHMRLSQGVTLVAIHASEIAAFGQLHPLDHIQLLYTAPAFARQGYATAVYQCLEARAAQEGMRRLRTEASRISRHFFTTMGFRVITPEIAVRDSVSFERFVMEKSIGVSG